MAFVLLVSVLFSRTPYHPCSGGGISGWGGIKMASASTPSANDPAKDLILVRMVSSGISDVAFASVISGKPV